MNEVDFFINIVEPTVLEFLADRHDVRRAILACVILQAMNEHYYECNKSDPVKVFSTLSVSDFKGELRKADWATSHVMDIANGIKHVTKRRQKDLSFDNVLVRDAPNKCGVMRADFPLSDDEIFSDDSLEWILTDILEHVLIQWRKRLDL